LIPIRQTGSVARLADLLAKMDRTKPVQIWGLRQCDRIGRNFGVWAKFFAAQNAPDHTDLCFVKIETFFPTNFLDFLKRCNFGLFSKTSSHTVEQCD
jgi:hypothetical protein